MDEWEVLKQVQALRSCNKIYLFTSMSDEEKALTAVHIVSSIEEAIRLSVDETGRGGGPDTICLYFALRSALHYTKYSNIDI